MIILRHINTLIKLNTISFKLNVCLKFPLHKYAITLVYANRIAILLSLFYMNDGYLSFIVLSTLPYFSLNQTTNTAHNPEKSVSVNEIVLLQVNI